MRQFLGDWFTNFIEILYNGSVFIDNWVQIGTPAKNMVKQDI